MMSKETLPDLGKKWSSLAQVRIALKEQSGIAC